MNFKDSSKVLSVIDLMRTPEINRSANRALLDSFFNGNPPWTEKEAEDNRISINFNDKAGAVLLHTARAQYENALINQTQYFKVTLPDAPADKQTDWASFISSNINEPIMDSSRFFYTQDEVFGGVCLHGVGAKMWWDNDSWLPQFVGMQDILMPTDTRLGMDDLQYFAVRRKIRSGELFRKTFGRARENVNPGWKLGVVRKILDSYKDLNQNPHNYDWANAPEQMSEIYKQNQNYYDSDAAPVIWTWDFFHREEECKNPGWYRKIILDPGSAPAAMAADAEPNPFVFAEDKPYAMELKNIIHFQFGDGNNVPPFMYHSIRSLAFLTYELLWTMNRLRCQWTQHVFEQMLTIFRITDPSDRSRLEKVVFESPYGIIPEGLNFVPAGERYSVDANLVGGLQQQYDGLIGRATSSYTQQIDHGSNKERTKFEVQAMLQQVSALMGSLLSRAYRQEHFAYREICRRFCNKKSSDFEVKKFRQKCLTTGKIPEKWLDASRWRIEVEQKLGGGNRMMEMAEAQQMMDKVNLFDPSSQAEIKRDYALAVTNNPRKAARLVPHGTSPGASDAKQNAEFAFAALMGGNPVTPKEGLSNIIQVETLLQLMGNVVGQIMKTGGVGDPKQLVGLHMAALYTTQLIQQIAQDPEEKARVKQYGDALGKIMNQVKAMEQRQQEIAKKQQAASQSGSDQLHPEVQGKIAASVITAQAKAKISSQSNAQKMKQKNAQFEANEKRKNLQTVAQIQRDHAKDLADVRREATAAARKPKATDE